MDWITIGTPDGGDPLANEDALGSILDFFNLSCNPALLDLMVGAHATMAAWNHNTKYHTMLETGNPL